MTPWEREEAMEGIAGTREPTGSWGKDCPTAAKVIIQYSDNSTGKNTQDVYKHRLYRDLSLLTGFRK